MKKKVLLTYGWCRTAYVCLKSLAARNMDVYVTDFSSTAMCRFSNLKKRFIKMPVSARKEEGYIDFLIRTIKQHSIDVFIPVSEGAFMVAKHMDRFPSGVGIPIEKYDKLMKVHNKRTAIQHASANGIPVPRTWMVDEFSDIEKIAKKAVFPVFVKNIFSQGSKGVFRVSDTKELKDVFSKIVREYGLTRETYPLIQEYVEGKGYGVSCLFDHGKVKAVFTHKRLLEKFARGGPSTRRISVKNSLLEGYARKYLESLNWHGAVMIEFRYDEASGRGYFIEANPRLWGSINLSYISGVDFPYLLYKIAVGESIESVTTYMTGIRSNWVLGDMMALIDHMIDADDKIRFLRDFVKFGADGYDDLNIKDMKPFFAELMDYLLKLLRAGSRNPVYKDFLLQV
jgi:predicted ATP-grasp superfamily ATP-dependent carboligase